MIDGWLCVWRCEMQTSSNLMGNLNVNEYLHIKSTVCLACCVLLSDPFASWWICLPWTGLPLRILPPGPLYPPLFLDSIIPLPWTLFFDITFLQPLSTFPFAPPSHPWRLLSWRLSHLRFYFVHFPAQLFSFYSSDVSSSPKKSFFTHC